MARSIHATRAHYWREYTSDFADEDAQQERLERLGARLDTKRHIKRAVQRERSTLVDGLSAPVPPEAVPIVIADSGPWVHYPASPEDIRGVLRRLPPGALAGLSEIRLCLGMRYQEEDLDPEKRSSVSRDPFVGRAGAEVLTGVHQGRFLGSYWFDHARIELYADVYEKGQGEDEVLETYLCLKSLTTLVHEVAHHEDLIRRVARGRWRADDKYKREDFAESASARWVRECVIPYLEEAYPERIRELGSWLECHGGMSFSLEEITGPWRSDRSLSPSMRFFGVDMAVEGLLSDVRAGEPRNSCRLNFAENLHFGEHYGEALQIIADILAEEPDHLAALALKADIFEHQQDYDGAEAVARGVVDRDPGMLHAWNVLADVYERRESWEQLLDATTRALELVDEAGVWKSGHHLKRARALGEIGRHAEAAEELDALPNRAYHQRLADSLRAVWHLQAGRYEESLDLARARLAEKPLPRRTVFLAVAFEAARALGRPEEGGALTPEDLNDLRWFCYSSWADRLASLPID